MRPLKSLHRSRDLGLDVIRKECEPQALRLARRLMTLRQARRSEEGGMDAWPPLAVKVWGDRACFTRPEAKVERVSYPVMTPSAAEGVLSSIFWKPEIRWRIEEIWVLNDIRWFSLLRNEVNRSEEHTSELHHPSISYAVFCLKKKK